MRKGKKLQTGLAEEEEGEGGGEEGRGFYMSLGIRNENLRAVCEAKKKQKKHCFKQDASLNL